MHDAEGWTETNLDVAGRSFGAVGVRQSSASFVNGIVFSVDDADLASLRHREAQYVMTRVMTYSFSDGRPLGLALLFLAPQPDVAWEPNSPAQQRYLEVCLEGASAYGREFADEFRRTTWIGGQRIVEFETNPQTRSVWV